MSSPASRVLFTLALIAVAALPGTAQKVSTPQKKSPPAAVPPARPVTPPVRPETPPAGTRSKPLAPGLRGEASTAEENEGREVDPTFDPKALLRKGKSAPTDAASTALHLANHPKRDELAKWLVDNLRGREIDIALLGGEKYMINSCLGIKVSSGTFKLKLDNPVVRFENSGIVLKFSIGHVSFSAIKLRMRPNPNLLEACSFSKKFEVGGSMEDVSLTLRLDPLYDPERCRLGWVTDLNPEVRIGNLNLKPLQNDLDRMAKNMVEDALTFALQIQSDGVLSAMGDQVLSAVDQFLEADCPTKPGDTGRAIADVTRGLGLGGGGAGQGGGSTPSAGGTAHAPGSGGTAPASGGGSAVPAGGAAGAPGAVGAAEVAVLLARIEDLETRIGELESAGSGAGSAQVGTSGPDANELALLLAQILEQNGGLDRPEAASQIFSELLAQLIAAKAQGSSGFDTANWLADHAAQLAGAVPALAQLTAVVPASAAAAAPWYVVSNPALTGRMGRIVVTFPDQELGKNTIVAVLRDGKKIADRYGAGAWELLPGVHDVDVTNSKVAGCDVRAGHDTIVRVGLLQVELSKDTLFAVYAKGSSKKLFDAYGTASIGLPIGAYEVEILGQREGVVLRDGEVTRF